jgi:hypothetical protein
LGEKSRRLAQYLIGPPKLTVFTLELFEALTLRRGQAGTNTLVTLGLPKPTAKGLAGAADLGCYGADGPPLGAVLPWCSSTIRTARSFTSGGYLIRLDMTPSSQVMESPAIPGRFK